MRTHQGECSAVTSAAPDFVDVTDEVEAILEASGISDGQVTVFSPDPSCAILVNERESGLLEDIKRTIRRLSPNGGSPRPGMLGSSSVVIPAAAGRLRLGTWQRILLVELSGAARRPVIVQIVGE